MYSKETEEQFNFPDRQAWQAALNKAPQDNWIKERNLGRSKSHYIPIAIQQAVADIFFNEFDVFEEKYTPIINEVLCTLKISVLPSYPNAEHRIISGTGVKPIQCSSGSTPEKFPRGKITNSLEYNAPAARSGAIGNALATFGNIFGRNLGRAVSAGYNLTDNKRKAKKKKKKK